MKQDGSVKYIVLRNNGTEGYDVTRFSNKEYLEKFLSDTYGVESLEIYKVEPQKLTVKILVDEKREKP